MTEQEVVVFDLTFYVQDRGPREGVDPFNLDDILLYRHHFAPSHGDQIGTYW